ncbi:hypothetical protein [Celerinatantimonas sp. YJH-8]|uniref:hypothetical protein n=1 Tax=Celerinatantimonas sp. YJH-8 TaxID=3228714 RepID=UPI0038C4976F
MLMIIRRRRRIHHRSTANATTHRKKTMKKNVQVQGSGSHRPASATDSAPAVNQGPVVQWPANTVNPYLDFVQRLPELLTDMPKEVFWAAADLEDETKAAESAAGLSVDEPDSTPVNLSQESLDPEPTPLTPGADAGERSVLSSKKAEASLATTISRTCRSGDTEPAPVLSPQPIVSDTQVDSNTTRLRDERLSSVPTLRFPSVSMGTPVYPHSYHPATLQSFETGSTFRSNPPEPFEPPEASAVEQMTAASAEPIQPERTSDPEPAVVSKTLKPRSAAITGPHLRRLPGVPSCLRASLSKHR